MKEGFDIQDTAVITLFGSLSLLRPHNLSIFLAVKMNLNVYASSNLDKTSQPQASPFSFFTIPIWEASLQKFQSGLGSDIWAKTLHHLHGILGSKQSNRTIPSRKFMASVTLICMRFPPFFLPFCFCFGHNYTCPPLYLLPSPRMIFLNNRVFQQSSSLQHSRGQRQVRLEREEGKERGDSVSMLSQTKWMLFCIICLERVRATESSADAKKFLLEEIYHH
ncbi:uncharacterized protein LOC110428181 isoform X2 [Herrania umbratica]|uniref:Uncharacterized protein LOC110428181 isoform X2 n=2 Tax=Herrania umbratica TaxID=108875 RepID=A0A6J1BMV5_9ROSI|nr:uncharacterized protein LOC110428181 isoform X2 [Herrania umbratica]